MKTRKPQAFYIQAAYFTFTDHNEPVRVLRGKKKMDPLTFIKVD